jgi:hypothetical protein
MRRTNVEHVAACLLRQRDTFRIQDPLPAIPEAHLRRVDLQKEAQTLFRCASYHDGFEIPAQGGNPKLEAERRIAKWALELMGQSIAHPPRTAIKSQVLADFVAE